MSTGPCSHSRAVYFTICDPKYGYGCGYKMVCDCGWFRWRWRELPSL